MVVFMAVKKHDALISSIGTSKIQEIYPQFLCFHLVIILRSTSFSDHRCDSFLYTDQGQWLTMLITFTVSSRIGPLTCMNNEDSAGFGLD